MQLLDSDFWILDSLRFNKVESHPNRISLAPEFVAPHQGGGAVGVRLSRFDRLDELVARLRREIGDR
jgi:hypothetical protein